MVAKTADSADGASAEVDQLFQQVCDSEPFRAAPAARNLLVYLWNHRQKPVSEYALALDALGKPSEFDPKSDASVRVAVARLRGKLKEFYEHRTEPFALELAIPRGGHQIEWRWRTESGEEPISIPAAPAPAKALAGQWLGIAFGIIGLAAFLTAVLVANRSAVVPSPTPATPLPQFWQSFLSGGKPTVVIVPSPLYFVWPKDRLYVRDLAVSKFADWPKSVFLKDMADRMGPPSLSQTYVGAVEMLAATRIVQYLERGGQPVEVIESAKFAAGSFAVENTISLGMPRTAGYLDSLMERTNFYLARVNPDVVANRHPRPGEPAEFRESRGSPEHATHPGIVIALPRRPEGTRSLLLVGQYPNGIVPLLTSVDGMSMLEREWHKAGSPDGWEMVVQAEIFRETALRVWPVATRPISSDFWN